MIDLESGYLSIDPIMFNFNAYTSALYLKKKIQHLKDDFFLDVETPSEKVDINDYLEKINGLKSQAAPLAEVLNIWLGFCKKIANNDQSIQGMKEKKGLIEKQLLNAGKIEV